MNTRPYDNPALRIMKNYRPVTEKKIVESKNNSFFNKPENKTDAMETSDIVSKVVTQIRNAREKRNGRTSIT